MNYSRISDPNDHLFFNEKLDAGTTQTKKEIYAMMKANKETPQVPNVVKTVIENCAAKLRATNCAFKIMMSDGTIIEHDADRLDPSKKRKKRVQRHAHGALKNQYWPHVKDLQVGDVAEVPYTDELPWQDVQSSMSAYLSHTWGKGTYATSVNKNNRVVEIIRLA